MTSTAPLILPGTGSLPPIGARSTGRPSSEGGGVEARGRQSGETPRGSAPPVLPGRAPIGGDTTAAGIGRASDSGAQRGDAVNRQAPPLLPGRPLIGGGPFTLAVAFGLAADETVRPQTAGSADTPDEAAAVLQASDDTEATGAGQLTEEEQQVVRELQQRDREVRQHEAAHAAAGGQYAGSPQFTYQSGPDGRQYAVGGSVSIDTSPVDGDPAATLQKARQIRAAALAPADPSAQDRSVASAAGALERQARAELSAERTAELQGSEESSGAEEPASPNADRDEGEGAIPAQSLTPSVGGAAEGQSAAPADGPTSISEQGATGAESPGSRRSDGPFGITGLVAPRSNSGFDGRAPASQIISITV